MRTKLTVGLVVGVLVLVTAGTAAAIPILDYNLGHSRSVPIRSLPSLDTPRHGQFGEIELSGCQLVLDKPSLIEHTTEPPNWPVGARLYFQCDTADLLFTGYEWTFTASRVNANGVKVFDSASGEDEFGEARVPAHWGTKLVDRRWACNEVNPRPRGTAQFVTVHGTITLFDTEGRDYPAKVTDRSYITCPVG